MRLCGVSADTPATMLFLKPPPKTPDRAYPSVKNQEYAYAAGMSVSLVARQHGIAPNQVFTWRRLYAEGGLSAIGAGEEVVRPRNTGALQQSKAAFASAAALA